MGENAAGVNGQARSRRFAALEGRDINKETFGAVGNNHTVQTGRFVREAADVYRVRGLLRREA